MFRSGQNLDTLKPSGLIVMDEPGALGERGVKPDYNDLT